MSKYTEPTKCSTTPTPELKDLVKIYANNCSCVILEVKPGHELDLMATGYFDGDETHLRLTKGRTQTCTVFRKTRPPYSWYWGKDRREIVSPPTERLGQLIQSCIAFRH